MPDQVGVREPLLTDDADAAPERAFEQLGAVADAVLYEGYLLYPYRRSSPKNRVRWQFGVLLPRDWVERFGPVAPGISGSADSWYQQTECLLRAPKDDAVVRLRVRHLQMQHKQVEDADGSPVESLRTADGATHLSFDEAIPRETELTVPLAELLDGGRTVDVGAPGGDEYEPLPGDAGRIVRRHRELRAATTVAAEPLAPGLFRLRVRTENTGEPADAGACRNEALRDALIATHTVLGGEGVEFVSLIDPPAALAERARGCRNAFTFPVLGGAPPQSADGEGETGPAMLSAPIILSDHPQVAPESPGDLHDAAEIDEILTLRTMLLTDAEKAEARATDPRAARILDRVDSMPREVFERLHGAIRSLTPAASSGSRTSGRSTGTRASTGTRTSAGADRSEARAPEPPAEARSAAPQAHRATLTPESGAAIRAAATTTRQEPSVPEPPAAAHAAGPEVQHRTPAPDSATKAPAAAPAAHRETPTPEQPTPAPPASAPVALVAPHEPPASGPNATPQRPAWWQEGGDEGLSPATDTVLVGDVPLGAGSPVLLRPRTRGADAQDMFLDGRSATVAGVFHDVDGSVRLAVTVDDDPAAELHGWYGRFHYFRPDEVEPLATTGTPAAPGRAHDRLRRRPQR
ncbi:hypothetical protein ME763_34250 [Streptomyces murinus]|uniref:hypothetical protein n=1 Tax=Streptomyces murinus TaxID=33900 RepID=UPI0023799925|nr:hypothetical protein [Streptomyces murinus]WDO10315.1 hypothetical protein ME763_34250 [Streptomyces murinus]